MGDTPRELDTKSAWRTALGVDKLLDLGPEQQGLIHRFQEASNALRAALIVKGKQNEEEAKGKALHKEEHPEAPPAEEDESLHARGGTSNTKHRERTRSPRPSGS